MGDAGRAHDSTEHSNYGSWQEWQLGVQLLQQMQSDYQQARKQLEGICSLFGERENVARKQLGAALESPGWLKRQSSQSMVMRLHVYCLGSFEVHLDNSWVNQWSSLKAKSLLKYLIAQRGRPVPKDVLMEALWAGWCPELASTNLRAAVHALRRTLGRFSINGNGFAYILFREGNYMLNPEVSLWVDDVEFGDRWMAGRRLEKEGKVEESIREYRLAEVLYRGDYLEDDLYEEWTLQQREALKDIYLTILGKLAENAAQAADYEGCVAYCHKMLAKDPCCEDSYRWLMRSYSRLGRRSRALHWYEVCERTIRAHLDVPPEQQTVALYHQLSKDKYI